MSPPIKPRRRVALLIETSRSYGRAMLRGIAAYARTQNNWAFMHQEMTIDVRLPDWMQESGIDGVIARVDESTVNPLRTLGVPCVDVRCSRDFRGIPQVETDDRSVARMAFEHLWDCGFRRFAFCGFQNAHYSENRLRFFREEVHSAGCPLAFYQSPAPPGAPTTRMESSGVSDRRLLTDWLASLTPPTGLFVCNDIRGQQILNACSISGLAVPDDIAVIGVDNDDTICPLSNPPLTSVKPDAERVGFRAAEVLDAMMRGIPGPATTEFIPPLGVVQRMSTEVTAVDDREVSRVCRFIREHACDGIDVHDVAAFTILSRRQLERRFRIALNQTPHAVITAVRLERVRQLLKESNLTLEQIAPLTGYSHKERLGAVFRRESGETPGEYRRRVRSARGPQ